MGSKKKIVRHVCRCFLVIFFVQILILPEFAFTEDKTSQRFDNMVKEAEKLRGAGDLVRAKEIYMKIYEDAKIEDLPEYRKKTRKAIWIIRKEEYKARLEEKRVQARKRKEEEKTRKEIERLEREKEQQEEASKKEKKRLLVKQVKRTYKEGCELHREGDYAGADEKFRQAQNEYPGYLRTEYFLERIPEDIKARDEIERKREEKNVEKKKTALRKQKERDLREKVKEKYQRAKKLYKSREQEKALEIFMEVQDLIPGYSKTEDYIRRITENANSE